MKWISKLMLVLLVWLLTFIFADVISHAAYVTAESGLCLRKEPDINSEVLEVLPIGTYVDAEIEDGWTPFRNGYLASLWLSDVSPLQLLGCWRITAYGATGSPCADGHYPEAGVTIACNSLPFGTKVYIEGVGVRTVMDRGPDYMGDEWCDLYLGDTATCIQWGDQMREVWLFEHESN